MIFVFLFSYTDNLIKWAIHIMAHILLSHVHCVAVFCETTRCFRGWLTAKLVFRSDSVSVLLNHCCWSEWLQWISELFETRDKDWEEKKSHQIPDLTPLNDFFHFCMNFIWWGHQHSSIPDVLLQHRAMILTFSF